MQGVIILAMTAVSYLVRKGCWAPGIGVGTEKRKYLHMQCVQRTGRTSDTRQRIFSTVLLDRDLWKTFSPQCGQDRVGNHFTNIDRIMI